MRAVVCLVVLALLALVGAVRVQADPVTLKIHRALSFDRSTAVTARGHTNNELGVRNALAKGGVSLFSPTPVGHKLLVTDLTSFDAQVEDVDAFLQLSTLGHLIFVPSEDKAMSENAKTLLATLEDHIANNKVDRAVYFAEADAPETISFLTQLQSGGAFTEYMISFDDSTVKKIPSGDDNFGSTIAHYLGGRVEGANAKANKAAAKKLPTLVVTASPDSLGVAPSLAKGQGASTAIYMEVARLMSGVYRNNLNLKKNVVMLLGESGRLNYRGTASWVQQLDNDMMDNFDFALCLDDVIPATTDKTNLKLHVSRSGSKDAETQRVYDALAAAAKKVGLGFEVKVKKINVSAQEVNYEHQTFSYRGLAAGTLRADKPYVGQLVRNSLTSNSEVDYVAVRKQLIAATKLVVEFLCKELDLPESAYPKESDINGAYLMSYYTAAATVARPHISGSADHETFFKHLHDSLARIVPAKGAGVLSKAKVKSKKESPVTFYGPLEVTVTIHEARSSFFELVISALVAWYLGCVYMFAPKPAGTASA